MQTQTENDVANEIVPQEENNDKEKEPQNHEENGIVETTETLLNDVLSSPLAQESHAVSIIFSFYLAILCIMSC